MAAPIREADVQRALLPWLSAMFLASGDIARGACEILKEYAPYKQTLPDVRKLLDSYLLTTINRMTGGSMRVMKEDYSTKRLSLRDLDLMTDDLMGVLFDSLTPFSANYERLSDYSLHNESLAALRVLHQKYRGFMTDEEYAFMTQKIKEIHPPWRYSGWLTD